ncbi:hypothetical protein [Nostoc sp.]|uniref:hypothetical protein n=1 Tax=Nostoc sp. TaxID=1180 RepID=UPI002FF9D250
MTLAGSLTAVSHGGNPHRPWRLPLGEDRTASPFQINETFTLYFFLLLTFTSLREAALSTSDF